MPLVAVAVIPAMAVRPIMALTAARATLAIRLRRGHSREPLYDRDLGAGRSTSPLLASAPIRWARA